MDTEQSVIAPTEKRYALYRSLPLWEIAVHVERTYRIQVRAANQGEAREVVLEADSFGGDLTDVEQWNNARIEEVNCDEEGWDVDGARRVGDGEQSDGN